MTENDVLDLCENLIDNVTVIKGFLIMSSEKDNYHIILARKELEKLIKSLTDFIDQISNKPEGVDE